MESFTPKRGRSKHAGVKRKRDWDRETRDETAFAKEFEEKLDGEPSLRYDEVAFRVSFALDNIMQNPRNHQQGKERLALVDVPRTRSARAKGCKMRGRF